MSVFQAPNGAIFNIPDEPGARSIYIRNLLNSLNTPFATKFAMGSDFANNFVAGTDPLSGEQQSSLLGIETVMNSPEQLDTFAQRLSDSSGGNKVDWIALLSGLWQTAKQGNIPGVSDELKKFEHQAIGVVGSVAADSIANRIARFIRDNILLILGGTVALILFVAYSFGKRR